jgi:hypothetical protein
MVGGSVILISRPRELRELMAAEKPPENGRNFALLSVFRLKLLNHASYAIFYGNQN